MKRMTAVLAAVGLAVLAWSGPAPLTVSELIKDVVKHDGKVVTVRGIVAEFKAKTSRKGNKYTTLKIKGGKDEAAVYLKGHLEKPIKDGASVEVCGTFRKEKKLGDQTFKNEIDATPEKGKPFGVKALPVPAMKVGASPKATPSTSN